MTQVEWPTIAALCAVVTAGGTAVLIVLRSQLAHFFITRREHVEMEARVASVEQRLAVMPSRDDFHALVNQIGALSGDIRAALERSEGTRTAIGRVEKQVDMLVQAQLEKEGREK